ncbi:hypothetical protein CTZ27_07540 [Streptomyces griseocarneus]|nr:hypothetical protein CTZ27_07540 [Streptomyces griseocarneus]
MAKPPPQAARSTEPDVDFEELCRALEQIDTVSQRPYRTEILGGNVVMSPWPKCSYDLLLDSLVDQLSPHAPEGHRVRTSPRLFRFSGQGWAYGPSLHVAESDTLKVRSIFAPSEALSLVGEVTPDAVADTYHQAKIEVCGKSGVPVHILIDVLQESLIVYSDPDPDRGYRTHTQVKIGDKVHIPAPFDCELDTADWEL